MTLAQDPAPAQSKSKQDQKENNASRDGVDNNTRLKGLVDKAKKSQKKAKKPSANLDNIKLPFQVLGFTAERKILTWYRGSLIYFTVPQLRSDIELFFDKNDEDDVTDIKSKILKEAREKGIVDETEPIKMGIWFINGKWLIVSGKTAVEVSKGQINEISYPVYEGKIIKFGKPWLNIGKFKEKFGKVSLMDVYEKIFRYVSQWYWKEKDAAEYMAALIMMIAFQHAMRWRPWVYVSGETGSGKSAFLDDVIELLYRDLVKRADKTTEHAIYQAVGNTSRILCLDEFEKSKHIPQVMEALKLMSRGGEKNTGTPGEKEITFLVHHLPILASIYTPATCLKDESQRNRIIQFELVKPKERKAPTIWSDEEAEALLAELVAAVMGHWGEIQQKADHIAKNTAQIKKDMDGKIDDRTVQNFMYASAILGLVTGKAYTVPQWSKVEKKSDGHGIIETIIFAKVRHENTDYLIADLIDAALRRPSDNALEAAKAMNTLRLHGLTIVDRSGWFLAIHPENATKNLLKGSDEYKNVDITMPLERLTGAERKHATFGNNTSLSCVQIPMHLVDALRGIAMLQ